MTLRPRPEGFLPVLGLALGLLSGPCASAHPLFRVHVRPSVYRVAPPRLHQVRLPAAIQHSAGLVAQAASLAPTAALARAVITQAPARALLGRH